jgi:hypothetical protein
MMLRTPARSAMNARVLSRVLATALFTALASTAWAAGSASSASLEGGSASVGSVSTSLETSSNASSNSSSGGDRKAEGAYRVERVAAAADRPGHVRVFLAPLQTHTDGAPIALVLPKETARTAALQSGDTVLVAGRPYGLAFLRADQPAPFFLALNDGARPEMRTRALGS